MVHCDFEKWSQNQHFQSTILVEREVVTERSMCTLLIMLTILDDLTPKCYGNVGINFKIRLKNAFSFIRLVGSDFEIYIW